MGKKIMALTLGSLGLLSQSSQAQSLPQYLDIVKHTLQLRSEIFTAKTRAFEAISKKDNSKFIPYCKEMQIQDSSFMSTFYNNKSYNYFSNNSPKSYKEEYMRSALLALSDAMGTRMQAIYLGCSDQNIDKATLVSVLNLLSNAYNGTQNAELWIELSDSMK